MKNKNTLVVFVGLFTLILLSRWSAHLWNMTLVGGALLFAGSYFQDKKIAVALMFSSMLVSDYVIGFHDQMISVYFSYLIMIGLGYFLKTSSSRFKVLGFSVLGSFAFYLITNFAVWNQGVLYPKTFQGLITCYVMAIEFYRNQVAGDIISALAIFELARVVKLSSLFVNSKV